MFVIAESLVDWTNFHQKGGALGDTGAKVLQVECVQ